MQNSFKTLALILALTFFSLSAFAGKSGNVAAVKIVKDADARFGLVNKVNGEFIVSPQYDYIGKFDSDGYAVYNVEGYFGLITADGKEVTTAQYDKINEFYDGFAMVVKDGKYGFINEAGEEVIPTKFDFATDFYGGSAELELNGEALIVYDDEEFDF